MKYLYVLHSENYGCGRYQKSQYTVVYENKEYYYCKVNGSDKLECFKKSDEDIYRWYSKTIGYSLNDFDMNVLIKQNEDKNNADKIEEAKKKVARKKQELKIAKKELEMLEAKININEIEKTIIALNKEIQENVKI